MLGLPQSDKVWLEDGGRSLGDDTGGKTLALVWVDEYKTYANKLFVVKGDEFSYG
ncbi:hypothetical protein [Nostoc parmelioides]|uniref:Transposase n=1 Tax=Nostoc parmelioides FACHB-3921 TaxID=2692909 RepID=A0ABR8B9X2_9NOSO|nr:hypothetical protein [Nostoc parmelioides]MBD2250892.1 hypothetical protein [Nostoc parmelioides FACHB-3921]